MQEVEQQNLELAEVVQEQVAAVAQLQEERRQLQARTTELEERIAGLRVRGGADWGGGVRAWSAANGASRPRAKHLCRAPDQSIVKHLQRPFRLQQALLYWQHCTLA